MPYTMDHVGGIPGRPPLDDTEKQAIAEEWNASEAKRAAERADPPVTPADMLAALFEHAPDAVKAAAKDKARARESGIRDQASRI